jgi:hypothetical protein
MRPAVDRAADGLVRAAEERVGARSRRARPWLPPHTQQRRAVGMARGASGFSE